MIITGGEKVYSTEVEAAAWSHPSVLEAACFGRPSETWGEEVVLAVVARPGFHLDRDDLLAHLREHLSSFKVPKDILALEALPKTGSGKISKQRLRESFGGA
jgi:acyl-CoA synthetase (AMP-forming)/AMP-acid ligase II